MYFYRGRIIIKAICYGQSPFDGENPVGSLKSALVEFWEPFLLSATFWDVCSQYCLCCAQETLEWDLCDNFKTTRNTSTKWQILFQHRLFVALNIKNPLLYVNDWVPAFSPPGARHANLQLQLSPGRVIGSSGSSQCWPALEGDFCIGKVSWKLVC